MNRTSVATLAAALLAAGSAGASEPAARHACAGIAEPAARLACYDRAFPPTAPGATAMVDVEEERQRALRDFGLNRQQMRETQPERMQAVSPDRIQGTVTRVVWTADGRRVVTLESGQSWMLIEAAQKGQLRAGDTVTIREAALGSFMLVTPGGLALRARRTR